MSKNNLTFLHSEMEWLEKVIEKAISVYLQHEGVEGNWYDVEPPGIEGTAIAYAQFVEDNELNLVERLCLALALCPNLRPELLDVFFGKNQIYDRLFTEFGGVVDHEYNGFLPTLQTLYFIGAGVSHEIREEFEKVFKNSSFLMQEQVFVLKEVADHIPENARVLSMNRRWVHYFLTGEELVMEQSPAFPAQKIETNLTWDDVVLENEILDELLEINAWLDKGEIIMKGWGLANKIKPGFRALFYGPPGTGKTLTAKLLGKFSGKDVYRIDLSLVVSKYIGETEKNLAKIFDIAEHKNWILFFDEADSLFGKRTTAQSSNDRHANQQTGYLLQRIEDYQGVVILATNLKDNIDAAFTRRFQSIIHFKMPGVNERLLIWQKAFSGKLRCEEAVDFQVLAENYEMAGGAIINVLRSCALSTVRRDSEIVLKSDLVKAIRREFAKEHKTIQSNI